MAETKEFVTLLEWANRRYPDKTPHINTLRNWVKAGLIEPKPIKHGRSYRVQTNAKYFDTESLSYA